MVQLAAIAAGRAGRRAGRCEPANLLVGVEQVLGLLDQDWIAPHDAFAALGMLHHQAGSFENRDVLLHGREGHVVGGGQLGDSCLAGQRPPHDVTPGAVSQGPEDPVDLGFAQFFMYNHLVVCWHLAKRPSTRPRLCDRAGT